MSQSPKNPPAGADCALWRERFPRSAPPAARIAWRYGVEFKPLVWARCWVRCWACRADISSPAPAFSRCSHLLQRSGSGSPRSPTIPTRTRVCCRQELGSARSTRAMALGARVSVGLGCTCASCDSAQPSSERGSAHHAARSMLSC